MIVAMDVQDLAFRYFLGLVSHKTNACGRELGVDVKGGIMTVCALNRSVHIRKLSCDDTLQPSARVATAFDVSASAIPTARPKIRHNVWNLSGQGS